MPKQKPTSAIQPPSITVSGVTFTAAQVKSAVVTIEGRDVFIGEKEEKPKKIGFSVEDSDG